jgi:hypothetical protein
MTLDNKAQLFIREARQLLDESFEIVEKNIFVLLQGVQVAP